MRTPNDHSGKGRGRKTPPTGKGRGRKASPAEAVPATATSIRALAKALRRSATAVFNWTTRADWPFGPPPWPVDRVREWTAIALSPDPAAALRARLANAEGDATGNAPAGGSLWAKRAQAELLQILARTQLLVQQYASHAGKLHDTEICQSRKVREIHAVREKLGAWPRTLSPRLVGLTRDEIERLLLAEVEAVCNFFAEGQ